MSDSAKPEDNPTQPLAPLCRTVRVQGLTSLLNDIATLSASVLLCGPHANAGISQPSNSEPRSLSVDGNADDQPGKLGTRRRR